MKLLRCRSVFTTISSGHWYSNTEFLHNICMYTGSRKQNPHSVPDITLANLDWFWALNANSSKMAKDTNFKFGTVLAGKVPRYDPLKFFFEKGAWPGSRDFRKFWVLNATSFKMAKDAVFKFSMYAHMSVPTWPLVLFQKVGLARVTWPR